MTAVRLCRDRGHPRLLSTYPTNEGWDNMNTRVNGKARLVISALGGLALASAMASCASTEMTSTWTDPAAKGVALSKVAVLCMTKDPGLRRQCEDNASNELRNKGAQSVASYQLVSDTDLKDREMVKNKLKAAGVDGVLMLRVTNVSEQVTPVGGPYAGFDGYYDWAGAGAWGPAPWRRTPSCTSSATCSTSTRTS